MESESLVFCVCLFVFNIYLAASHLSCDTQDLELRHVGSSSLARSRTQAPSIESLES